MGDLLVVSICIVMLVLMVFSYNRKSRSFRLFLGMIALLIISADVNVTFNMLARLGRVEYQGLVGALRCVYHACLYGIFVHYVVYILEVSRLEKRLARCYLPAALAIYVGVVAVDVATTLTGQTVHISEEGVAFQARGVFFYGYLAFVALIVALMARIRKRLNRNVMLGFYGTMAISFGMLLQGLKGQSSFTVATFLYPVIAMFYIMHSNPYDVRSGAIDSRSMDDYVRYSYRKHCDFIFMSLYMPAFDDEGRIVPEEVQAAFRSFTSNYFRKATLFQLGLGHLALAVSKRRNPDYEARIERAINAFESAYSRFRYDYKIVVGASIPEISRDNEYLNFIRGVHRGMAMNTIYRTGPEDVRRFRRYELLQAAPADICAKEDLDDPRVLAYCQPVYNIRIGRCDTAEALMRLELDGLGLVFPDRFISLAEENGQIHTLTKIILHKTCEAVKGLIARGYEVCRVSVNVSAIELKEPRFCQDIVGIIRQSGIPGEKIAIELTESRTDSDFDHTKQMIEELRQHGIKFYLDDFGTGYSNMERIMELPFDIIKFDRSMVLASEASERFRAIVLSLAHMFDGLDYSVLYEGVEKESEERMCMDMSASYLQGYKYSRPVPIERLEAYFYRAA